MGDRMTPIPFNKIMNWIVSENKKGSIFGIKRYFKADKNKNYEIFGRRLETPFGPAAGPHTQLAQNIIAAYISGSRFFELKTVQKIDGEDLPVSKPCILAEDECYNCEWSTELYVTEAFNEYVKAYFAIKVISKELDLGSPDGFIFNMSVGYDLEGIKLPKIDNFIEGLKNAEATPIFKECKGFLLDNLDLFNNITKEDILSISSNICDSATLSTLHGCPPQEIERIASYLLTEKHVHTFIKCNPTLLGYEYAREVMDKMGYDYIAFGDFHFKDDLQYSDAVPMLKRLQNKASENGLEFGVKITNTFPVDVKQNELPSEEMYMSGKALYPLSMSVAKMLTKDFSGGLRISYSGGADYFNIERIVASGIWPVTMATTLLKVGGYQRLTQIGEVFSKGEPSKFTKVDLAKVSAMVEDALVDKHHLKAIKPLPTRKIKEKVPLIDCFFAPCQKGCPIGQDITSYMKLEAEGRHDESLEVILNKNPLPFMTGTLCAHNCMTKCTRNFYEEPVNIRRTKLSAAEGGFDNVIKKLKPTGSVNKNIAVIGGGPAGLSAAYFLGRAGAKVTIFEKEANMGGVVRNIIPSFRISDEAIEKDVEIVKAMGVKIVNNCEVKSLEDFMKGFDYVVVAVGASKAGGLKLSSGKALNALEFLREYKLSNGNASLGENVVVVGGGNTAMDTARTALKNNGVKRVSLVYRRTKRYMPADEEELIMALEDGVLFAELLAPIEHIDGSLVCKKMALGDFDSSGRRGIIETDEVIKIPCDTVIAAVGEQTPKELYISLGIEVDEKGRPIVNSETMESKINRVYVIGDGATGPKTIVEAISSGTKAALAILGDSPIKDIFEMTNEATVYGRKGVIKAEDLKEVDGNRCLSCDSYCENCTEVCPNRANIAIKVDSMEKHQIIHVDYMCNECGNCKSFCPWDSAPYLDKFTVFENEADFNNSENDGFTVLDRALGKCKVRFYGKIYEHTLGDTAFGVPFGLDEIMTSVVNNYSYIL